MTPAAPGGPPALAVEAVLTKLRGSGGRITVGRRAIVELLTTRHDQHLCAETLIEEVRTRLPDLAESTIYRTLAALEELGVISHVHLGHGPATIHLAEDDHRHLVCTRCNAVIAVPATISDDLAKEIKRKYGFAIEAEHFALTGQCAECQRGSDPPAGPQATKQGTAKGAKRVAAGGSLQPEGAIPAKKS